MYVVFGSGFNIFIECGAQYSAEALFFLHILGSCSAPVYNIQISVLVFMSSKYVRYY